jgi:RNA polymerase sigma factor (sigma-70 family)
MTGLAGLTDEKLMELVKLGDSGAFALLYDRHGGKLYGYLRKRLTDAASADDLLQETFLRILRFRSKYRSGASFSPWMFTICANCMADHFRARAVRDAAAENPPEWALADRLPPPESKNVLADPALNGSLTENEQKVLELRYTEDLSFSQISSKLGLSAANARKIANRAVQKLRVILR